MADEQAMKEKLHTQIARAKEVYEDPLMQMMCLSVIEDEVLVRELGIRGFPEELTKPLRDFLRQPIATPWALREWQQSQGAACE
jgi:hypothetical protein